MTFAGAPFAESTFGGVAGAGLAPALPDTGGPPPATVEAPFVLEIDGLAANLRVNTLRIDAQLGRPGGASFELQGLSVMPDIGHSVRILYFKQLIFAGAVDRIQIMTEPSQTHTVIACECTDHSYLLFRRKINKTFTNGTIGQIATTIANNELLGDGVTVGTVDGALVIPLAKAEWVSIYEFLSGLATAVGAVFYVDYDKRMHFISTTVTATGTPLTASNMETLSFTIDREHYRNQQTTTVSGTPTVEGQQPVTVELTRSNQEQILQRYDIENTTGIYNEHVAVTHPTSNNAIELTRLAQASNKIALGLSGSLGRVITVQTRQYGYSAGQFVTVTLDYLGISGSWVVQRLQLREEAGLFLLSTLEMTQSTLMRRQQELWVDVVSKGTIAVMPPSAIYTNSLAHTTPGLGSWQVPSGVTDVQITCYGGGGGGGGGAKSEFPGYAFRTADGAAGGSGGVSITILTVTPGEVLTFWVGVGGNGGAGQYRFGELADAKGGNGTIGTASWVERNGAFRVGQANPGGGGIGGVANAWARYSNVLPNGQDGTALYGNVTTTGGAGNAGARGLGVTNGNGGNGANGRVVMEW